MSRVAEGVECRSSYILQLRVTARAPSYIGEPGRRTSTSDPIHAPGRTCDGAVAEALGAQLGQQPAQRLGVPGGEGKSGIPGCGG